MSAKQATLTESERAPIVSAAIGGCFEQIKDAAAILETAYVALDKADDGDEDISVSEAITTLRIGLEHLHVVQLALDHLSVGGGNVEKAIALLNGATQPSA